MFGADLSARMGLPYAFASHFAPDYLVLAVNHYRATYQPSALHLEPYAIVAANAVVAGTEAEYLYTTVQQKFLTFAHGDTRFRPPVESTDALWSSPKEAGMVGAMMRESFVRSLDTVRAGLEDLVDRTGANELVILSEPFAFSTRLCSYELLAKTWTN